MSLYECQRQLKPQKRFKKLEHNLLKICRQRLQKYDVTMHKLDIRCVGAAYVLVIEMNLNRGRLAKAEQLAKESLKLLEFINDQRTIPTIYINLLEIYFHNKRIMDCFPILDDLKEIVDACSPEIWALTYCALFICMMHKLKGKRDLSQSITHETS
ncbi:uncharacterized protein TNCV_1385371 [Trichonephila clavipes]|nr:uncharacterized protein TNCV_1385371 [Trichonephila clavipes]